MSSSVDEKDHKTMQEYYIIIIIIASLPKIAVIFIGLSFYGIAKTQRYL